MRKFNLASVFGIIIFSLVIGLIVYAVTFLVHNENNRIWEGVVVDKNFSPAYSSVSGGRNNISAYSSGDSYQMCISGEKNGKTVQYWFECTAQEYNTYKVGDYYKK